jgi:glycosyltransferase involved in cell wall biosynthesis
MLRRIAERSLAVVVHNPRAAEMVREHAPGAAVHEIPHLWEQPPLAADSDVIRLRAELGLLPHTCLFGVFGHLRESKRLPTILRAFERARQAADMALLIAGDFASTDLRRSLEPVLTSPGILRIGHTEESDFWRYAAAVDACVNLRYPAAGETSGIAIRLMGIGKPVILTASRETSRFPETACVRVDAGVAEEEMLADYMVWLARYPEDARSIGRRAAAHIQGFHAVEQAAALYWRVLEGCYHKSNGNQ